MTISRAAEDVLAERHRQMEVEGWSRPPKGGERRPTTFSYFGICSLPWQSNRSREETIGDWRPMPEEVQR